VVFGKFRFGSRVDDLVKPGELCYGGHVAGVRFCTQVSKQFVKKNEPMNDPIDMQKIKLTAFSHGGG